MASRVQSTAASSAIPIRRSFNLLFIQIRMWVCRFNYCDLLDSEFYDLIASVVAFTPFQNDFQRTLTSAGAVFGKHAPWVGNVGCLEGDLSALGKMASASEAVASPYPE